MKTQSQIFDFGRFAACLRRDIALNGKSWALKALMMLGVTTILLIIATHPIYISDYSYEAAQADGDLTIFKFCGSVFFALGASMFMENMTSSGLRLNSLMSPASNLEKYLSRLVICVVGVIAAYLICYAIADALRVAYVHYRYSSLTGVRYIGPLAIQSFAESKFYLWGYLLAVQATFVLGSTFWPKNSFLKTFGTMVVLAIVLIILTERVFSICYRPGYAWFGLPEFLDILIKAIPLCWSVFCYVTAYFRFKESEIINRF